jgi:hypothetical protein
MLGWKRIFGKKKRVSDEENILLEAQLSEEEILLAIKGSYSDGAPGPDGFSFMFYQKIWSVIKDFMALVRSFDKGDLNINRINYARIILIPKEEGARSLKKFRPISLINCSFKIFAKALNNRLERVGDRLLAPNQTAFVKRKYILESVVSAHEIIHSSVKGGDKGLVLKLDYEKAYDRVDWGFLEEMLRARGFGPRWVSWVMKLVQGGSTSISTNNENSAYFQSRKGLRQGDPLSPLLFNLVVDVFTRLLIKAARKGYIAGLMDSLYPEGVISLQYVDDTLLFLKHDYQDACHLKWLLVCFEQLSGVKINYNKSDMVPINLNEEETQMYSRIFAVSLELSRLSI